MTCSFCQTEMILLRSLHASLWVCPSSGCGASVPQGANGDDYQYRYTRACKYALELCEQALEEAAKYAEERQNPTLAEGMRQAAHRAKMVRTEERKNKWFKQALGEKN